MKPPLKISITRIPPKRLKLIHALGVAERGRLVEEKAADTTFAPVGTNLTYQFKSKSAAVRWFVASMMALDRLPPREEHETRSLYNHLMKNWITEPPKSDLTAFLDDYVSVIYPDTALSKLLKGE